MKFNPFNLFVTICATTFIAMIGFVATENIIDDREQTRAVYELTDAELERQMQDISKYLLTLPNFSDDQDVLGYFQKLDAEQDKRAPTVNRPGWLNDVIDGEDK